MPVGGEPIGIVEGFGSVWVVNSEFDSGGAPSVSRIDPASATVVATIPVGAVPLEAAVAFDAVWVSNSEDDTVSRIDPATNEVAATVDVCGAPEGMAADEDGLWVVCEESGSVVRIDPGQGPGRGADRGRARASVRDRRVRQRVGLELPRFDDHATRSGDGGCDRRDRDRVRAPGHGGADGGVWVSSVDSDAVQRIDPATNERKPRSPRKRSRTGSWSMPGPSGSPPTWADPPDGLDPAAAEITGTWVVSDQGAIAANQLVVEAAGAFWFPQLDGAEVLKVTIPS